MIMANESSPDSPASFVFAYNTTASRAMEIQKIGLNFEPNLYLRARRADEWHYRDRFGFRYADMDGGDPLQAALMNMSSERDARVRAIVRAEGPFILQSVDPMPVILIVLGAISAGIAQEAGKDIWAGLKIAAAWLWRRLRREKGTARPVSPLIR